MKEIQADIFATLSLSMYDFELPDSLKEHLKNNYTSLSNNWEEQNRWTNH